MKLRLESLTRENWGSFAQLLGGAEFGGCYCAVWTHFGDDWSQRCRDADRPNLAATRRDLELGRRPGYLVRDDRGAVLGWTGSGPRSEFPLLDRRLGARRSTRTDTTWCIGCVALSGEARGQGLSAQVIREVVALARKNGAPAIEAYPVDPWDEPRSYRGALSTYLSLGFREITRERDEASAVVLVERRLSVDLDMS